MRIAWLSWSALGLTLMACGGSPSVGQSGGEGLPREVPDGRPPGNPKSPGPSECSEDLDCEEPLRELEAALGEPGPGPGALSDVRCDFVSVGVGADGFSASGPACECDIEGFGTGYLGPIGASACHVPGRGGDCLFVDEDFEGCDPGDASSCQASCDLLLQRLEADAARTFETEIVSAVCEGGGCGWVMRIDDLCYPGGSERSAQGYDCALGVDGIIAAHAEANRSPEESLDLIESSRYPPGTDGILELSFERSPELTDGQYFGAFAQFYVSETEPRGFFGEVLDPLEGPDDCSITRRSALGSDPFPTFLQLDKLSLIDGDQRVDLPGHTSATPGDGYYAYSEGLTAAGLAPRFGGSYGFVGGGGSFGPTFEIDGIVLPDALQLDQGEPPALDPATPTLRWTGAGTAPLQVHLGLKDETGRGSDLEIYCELIDDGEHTLDPALFENMDATSVIVYAVREQRQRHAVADKTLLSIASVAVHVEVALER